MHPEKPEEGIEESKGPEEKRARGDGENPHERPLPAR